MGRKSGAPTMKDVAAEAGVALGTVSKVVNGIPVGEVYQKRVESAIRKLGYRVNIYAQGLRANKTYTVAFLIPNTVNPFFGALTYHISRILEERGHRMLLCTTDISPEEEQAALDMAQQNQVDGIISLTYSEHLRFGKDTPLVTIDRHISPLVPCVSSDNYGGGQLAARQLIRLGCRSLAFLGQSSPLANETAKRHDGFMSACAMQGVPHEALNLQDGTPSDSFLRFLFDHMAGGKLAFDGIFCNTDHLAQVVIRALRQAGIRVPEDVQIIGYDGLRDYATGELLCSSIAQPIHMMARMSVDMVLNDDWSRTPSLVCLPVEYVYGGTTKEQE